LRSEVIGGTGTVHDLRLGCLLISAPQGHSGKTTVTVGLCYTLRQRGLSIQPFKKGPDYIDPSWLSLVTGRHCRNLDLFLIPKDKLINSFRRACRGADMAIIEGAMGLYDGMDSVDHGTTAEVARLLDAPILLVVNTVRMTGSIAAMVSGYQHFQQDTRVAGVVLNHVSGSRHERKLREAVEQHCGIPVVGSIPKDEGLRIEERHLGLIPSLESDEAESSVERIGKKISSCFDLDRILVIAQSSTVAQRFPVGGEEGEFPLSPRTVNATRTSNGQAERVKVGVLRDRAFNFYYPENVEALEEAGAEVLSINSFKDRLPGVDGLYIGGGFPEFFLEELEKNRSLRKDIANAVEAGLPVYAECAGLMYLCRTISWKGRSYEMVGVIPSDVQLSKKPQGHGYVVADVVNENPLFPVGLTLHGHEFHHSNLINSKDLHFVYRIQRGEGVSGNNDGIVYKNVFASYVHLHALGTPEWATGFVSLMRKERVFQLREGNR
jgi:cobyrinic acid a,c-diamide synthase